MSEHRHYSGPDLAPLLRRVRDELGSDAEIIRAERIRTGGLAGFFAREHYEVVAKQHKAEPTIPMEPTAPSEARRNVAIEQIADGSIADEPISRASASTRSDELVGSTAKATVPAKPPASTPTGLSTAENIVAAGGTGRSIQAALLDRADRVSTEELLVRVAETHSAEWGSESFHSILGRAMVDAVGPSVDATVSPSVDTTPIAERRREPEPVDAGPDRADHAIDGLRLESIRPGENVVDPVPQPPPAEPSQGEAGARHPEHEPWANAGPPHWGQHWMPGWAPWMSNGWPVHAPGDPASGSAPHRLCANCAGSLSADADDDRPSPPTLDAGTPEKRDDGVSWSELRQEIDDIRRRLDGIIGTIRHASGDEYRSGGEPPETLSDDEREPASDRRRTDR